MNSQKSRLHSTSLTVDLPKEIILDILNEYLNLPSPQLILRVLVLAKWSYNWMLPKLYHSLSTVGPAYPRPGRVIYESLLAANPSSLALVQRVQCNFVRANVSFCSFPNLTHLVLWDSCSDKWWNSQVTAIAMLRLEELFVWHRRDLDTLSFAITDNTPISSTLRRLCFYDHSIRFPNPKWTQCCPNLTHVLIFCSSFHTLKGFLKTSLQNLGTLRCFLIAPTWNYNPTLADVPEAVFAGDRRVALVLEQFKHFDHQGQLFWLDQKDMWKELEERVSKNAHPKQVTVINSFSL